MMSWLDVSALALQRGGVIVLQNVSFALSAGDALVLRGPNGIGKTTLLRTLAGLQPPAGGKINLPESGVAYNPHADGLKAMLSVAENLDFWAAVNSSGSRFQRQVDVREALSRLGLAPLRDRLVAQLSAGQKRRLGLARLLLTGSGVWLMDEPTVSLDAEGVDLCVGIIEQHLKAGGMIVLATHIDVRLPAAQKIDLSAFRVRNEKGATFGFEGVFL